MNLEVNEMRNNTMIPSLLIMNIRCGTTWQS